MQSSIMKQSSSRQMECIWLTYTFLLAGFVSFIQLYADCTS